MQDHFHGYKTSYNLWMMGIFESKESNLHLVVMQPKKFNILFHTRGSKVLLSVKILLHVKRERVIGL